jgi:ribosomal protein S18 acetylase RimI-like enzyme
MTRQIYVRNLEARDLKAIVSIEERQTGVARPDFWTQRIDLSEAIRPHWASLIAELDGRVVGFVFGRAGELEFGLPGTVAWIEIIGVDPGYRGRGVARSLVRRFEESAQDHGVRTIFTLVGHDQDQIQQFFNRIGFVRGRMLHYQKQLSD